MLDLGAVAYFHLFLLLVLFLSQNSGTTLEQLQPAHVNPNMFIPHPVWTGLQKGLLPLK